MGQNFINLLTVVFPLVSFLWAGALILLCGTLICLTPPWFARTVIGLTRARPRRPTQAAVASTAVTTLLLLVALPVAHGAMPQPRGMAPPPPGHALPDVYGALTCACPGFGEVALTLADAHKIVDKAEETGTPLRVGYSQRFKRRYLSAKDQIDQGRLGEITALTGRACNTYAQVMEVLKRSDTATPVVDALTY